MPSTNLLLSTSKKSKDANLWNKSYFNDPQSFAKRSSSVKILLQLKISVSVRLLCLKKLIKSQGLKEGKV